VAQNPNEVLLSFLTLKVSAKGTVALIVGVSVAVLILAVAWKLVQ